MDKPDMDAVFERLALVMQSTPPQVGVAMGWELFREAHKRGLIVARTFTISGTGLFPMELPTYEGKLFAYLLPDLPDWEFRIGRSSNAQGT